MINTSLIIQDLYYTTEAYFEKKHVYEGNDSPLIKKIHDKVLELFVILLNTQTYAKLKHGSKIPVNMNITLASFKNAVWIARYVIEMGRNGGNGRDCINLIGFIMERVGETMLEGWKKIPIQNQRVYIISSVTLMSAGFLLSRHQELTATCSILYNKSKKVSSFVLDQSKKALNDIKEKPLEYLPQGPVTGFLVGGGLVYWAFLSLINEHWLNPAPQNNRNVNEPLLVPAPQNNRNANEPILLPAPQNNRNVNERRLLELEPQNRGVVNKVPILVPAPQNNRNINEELLDLEEEFVPEENNNDYDLKNNEEYKQILNTCADINFYKYLKEKHPENFCPVTDSFIMCPMFPQDEPHLLFDSIFIFDLMDNKIKEFDFKGKKYSLDSFSAWSDESIINRWKSINQLYGEFKKNNIV